MYVKQLRHDEASDWYKDTRDATMRAPARRRRQALRQALRLLRVVANSERPAECESDGVVR